MRCNEIKINFMSLLIPQHAANMNYDGFKRWFIIFHATILEQLFTDIHGYSLCHNVTEQQVEKCEGGLLEENPLMLNKALASGKSEAGKDN